ncbi:MAG: SET domain-containing protein-lysine N-methyltransferase [Chloroflexi bacterium]|nr:SET domain-containing protein-lysine N-methyltransferase [Chloroflexota bacterium]
MLKVEPNATPYGARLITTSPLKAGEVFYKIANYRVVHQPTYQTIQVGPETHIEELGVIAYLNHSCSPNVIVDTAQMECRAAREVAAGEELSFFYPSTEWNMDRPFVCLCGAPQCIRIVTGAKFLSLDTLSRYFVNQHIREMALECLVAAALH